MPPAFPHKVILFRYIAGGILSLPYDRTDWQHIIPPGRFEPPRGCVLFDLYILGVDPAAAVS